MLIETTFVLFFLLYLLVKKIDNVYKIRYVKYEINWTLNLEPWDFLFATLLNIIDLSRLPKTRFCVSSTRLWHSFLLNFAFSRNQSYIFFLTQGFIHYQYMLVPWLITEYFHVFNVMSLADLGAQPAGAPPPPPMAYVQLTSTNTHARARAAHTHAYLHAHSHKLNTQVNHEFYYSVFLIT